jgi:hypothetical protein
MVKGVEYAFVVFLPAKIVVQKGRIVSLINYSSKRILKKTGGESGDVLF